MCAAEYLEIQQFLIRASWGLFHHTLCWLLSAKGKRRKHIGSKINGEYLHNSKRQRDSKNNICNIGNNLWYIRRKDICNKFPYIFTNAPSFFNCIYNRCEIIIQQDHIRCFPC